MAKNVILISYDGVRKGRILELLAAGSLPALTAITGAGTTADVLNQPFLKKNGIYTPIDYPNIVDADTIFLNHAVTDSGHARILAGRMSPYANMCLPTTEPKIDYICSNNYNVVPGSLTIFETIKNNSNMVIGVSSGRRADSREYDALKGYAIMQGFTENIWAYGLLKYITGHGFFSTTFANAIPSLDFFFDSSKTDQFVQGDAYWNVYTSTGTHLASAEIKASKVAQKAADFITANAASTGGFFIFVHFCEPDLFGHLYGEGSQEYKTAIIKCDEGLGIIASKLTELGIYNDTLILVTTDHGATINSTPGTFERRLTRKILVELGPLHGDVNLDNHVTAIFTNKSIGVTSVEMTNIAPIILKYLGMVGNLSVTSSIEGTDIYINSAFAGVSGSSPLNVSLPAGRYEVYAVKGTESINTVDITAGGITTLNIEMPAPTPIPTFGITIDSSPSGAQVATDPGTQVGRIKRENTIETLLRSIKLVKDKRK